MRKRSVQLAALAVCFLLNGCSGGEKEPERLKELNFTVISEEKLPEELKEMIDGRKESPFKITYMKEGWLYVAEGYGAQKGGGYSICVNDFFESENALYVDTTLLGNREDTGQSNGSSYPYIVLKTEAIDKNVVFR